MGGIFTLVVIHTRSTAVDFDIVHGDCVPGMEKLNAKSVDVVVTSPPYNIGIGYSSYDDNRAHPEYLDWCEEWGTQIARILKPGGSFFLNLGNTSGNPLFAFEVAA